MQWIVRGKLVHRIMRTLIWLTVGVLASASLLLADERVERLPEADRLWLEEEVVYIIAKREKDVFLDLTTTQERDRSIEAFWERRDPDPLADTWEELTSAQATLSAAMVWIGTSSAPLSAT